VAKKLDYFYKFVTPVYDDAERRSLYRNVLCSIWTVFDLSGDPSDVRVTHPKHNLFLTGS